MSTDMEIWLILRGKFCDQLNECQLVRHQLTFNHTDKESISDQIIIPSATTTLPLPKLCESVWFENNAAIVCFRFVTSLFNVHRSNNYSNDRVCLSVFLSLPVFSIRPSAFNISTPLEGFSSNFILEYSSKICRKI